MPTPVQQPTPEVPVQDEPMIEAPARDEPMPNAESTPSVQTTGRRATRASTRVQQPSPLQPLSQEFVDEVMAEREAEQEEERMQRARMKEQANARVRYRDLGCES